MDLEKVREFMESTPPKWCFKETGNRNGRVHIVMTSGHKLEMLLLRRGTGDALCRPKEKFTQLLRTPKPDMGKLCPKCVELAERLLAANKATEGKTVRYMEERFE